MPLLVVQFSRDPRPNTYSIERLYEDVRSALPPDVSVVEWRCRNSSKGVFPRLRDAWAARKMQANINHVTGDTHYLTYFLKKKKTVLTVHDLVSIERSRGIKRWLFWFFWFWLPVSRSAVVITVSEATRQALIEAIGCEPKKVVVIHNPVSEEFQPSPKAFNADCPRILQVGTKPNKNLDRVVEALAGLSCQLIIVGPLSPQIERVLVQKKIDFENYVGLSREALLVQYRRADMLMFASTYEGFGLPIVEANAVGRPVITSKLSPMTEVAGQAACYVDPFDSKSIRAGVERVIADEAYRKRLVEEGYVNAQHFRVQAVAENYASVYRTVASSM